MEGKQEQLLLWLIEQNENEFIEFKVNNDKPELMGEYISALSNSAAIQNVDYGYLIYGVEDESREIVGTNVFVKSAKVGNEELISWLFRMLDPKVNVEFMEFSYEQKEIVILKIQAANAIPVKFKNVAYVRIGSYKKSLLEYPEQERIIWERKNTMKFEEQIALKGLSEGEVLKYLDYASYFDLTDTELPENRKAIIDIFISEGFIVKEEYNYCITNFGGILFAKNLNKFSNLSRKVPRVIFYEGNNKLRTKKEHIATKGYAVAFEGLITYINDHLPHNEEIGKVFRKEVKMYPEIAIRELVANALIHQDFSIQGTGPMIEVYDNRIEISNPGVPLMDVLRFIDTVPKSRNERLASFMRRINICEERGSGIDKTIYEIENYQLPAPDFIADKETNNTISILYSQKDFKEMDKQDKIRACFQHCVLKYTSREFMTNASLRDRFDLGKNNKAAWRVISDTIDAGMIKVYDSEVSSKKFMKYVPFWS